jgi:hypothetical protein
MIKDTCLPKTAAPTTRTRPRSTCKSAPAGSLHEAAQTDKQKYNLLSKHSYNRKQNNKYTFMKSLRRNERNGVRIAQIGVTSKKLRLFKD